MGRCEERSSCGFCSHYSSLQEIVLKVAGNLIWLLIAEEGLPMMPRRQATRLTRAVAFTDVKRESDQTPICILQAILLLYTVFTSVNACS